MPRKGSCLCRAVTYEIDHEVNEMGVCHCMMCRKWSGGVYLAVAVPADKLRVSGDVQTYRSSSWAERTFCPRCGTSLWYRVTAPGPHQGEYHLGFGTLDDKVGMKMTGEIFIDKKPEAYSFSGDHQTLTEAEFIASISAG